MRVIPYTVGGKSISTSTVQFGGFAGEDCATKLVFQWDEAFWESMEGDLADYHVLLEVINNSGEYDVYPLAYDSGNYTEPLFFDIPKEITELGGKVTMQLSIVELDEVTLEQKRKLYTYPIKLRFSPSTSGGVEGAVEYERYHTDVLSAMVRAEQAKATAKEQAQASSDAANTAEGFAQSAQQSASAASQSANDAAAAKSQAEKERKAAETAKINAEQSATNASESESGVQKSAEIAAMSEENAQKYAAIAAVYRDEAELQAQTSSNAADVAQGFAETAEQKAGAAKESAANSKTDADRAEEAADRAESTVVNYVESRIEQNFDPEESDVSKAQSAKAVIQIIKTATLDGLSREMVGRNIVSPAGASAVVDYVEEHAVLKPQWQLYKEIVLENDVSVYSEKVEDLGDTTKGVRVKVVLPANTVLPNNRLTATISLNKNREITVRAESWPANESVTACCFDILPRADIWNVDVAPFIKALGNITGDISYSDGDKVRYIKFQTNSTNLIPAGTKIIIWGLQ